MRPATPPIPDRSGGADGDGTYDLLPAWRVTCTPDTAAAGEEGAARLLGGRLSVAHRLWPRARAGDDAAAVAVALDLLETGREGHDLDLAMWALRPLALGGNSAARLVLDHASAALARRRASAG